MAPSTDLRRTVGTTVKSRARLVTNDAECKRYYGSLWKSTTVQGSVLNVDIRKVNNRNLTFLTVNFSLPNREKEVTLSLSSVKLGNGVDEAVNAAEEPITEVEPINKQDIEKDALVTPSEVHVLQLQTSSLGENGPVQSTVIHGRVWETCKTLSPLNACMQMHQWKVVGQAGDFISPRHVPPNMSAFDFFLWMFPMQHLQFIVNRKYVRLESKDVRRTSGGELLKFFGILILMTRIEFSNRRDLWSLEPFSKFIPQPNIGLAMSRNRFEMLRSPICFSGNGVTEEQGIARLSFVADFVKAINDHLRSFVTPSHALCVEDGMSRWYGLGGSWIDVGLPNYTALDRKPENGLEMKAVCCARSGIMLNIELNMSANIPEQVFDSDKVHGTAVLLRIVQPWFGSERLVCADSFLASVSTAKALLERDLRFTGVVKNCTREYPMTHFSETTPSDRRDFVPMLSKGSIVNNDIMAIMWMDRERRYFVSTYGTVNTGSPIVREMWTREENISKKWNWRSQFPKCVKSITKTIKWSIAITGADKMI